MKITAENLAASGYRHFPRRANDPEHRAGLYQKRVEDESGTRYFINVEEYDFKGLNIPDVVREKQRFSPNGQFSRGEGDSDTMTFSFSQSSDATIEDMEAFFDELFTKMEFNHYEHNGYVPSSPSM